MSNQNKRANRQVVETPSVTPAAETPSEVLETPAAETPSEVLETPAAETVTPAAETVSTFKVEGLRAEYGGTLPLSLGVSVGASWETHRDAWVKVFLAVLNHPTLDRAERQLTSPKLKAVPEATKTLLRSLYIPAEVTPPTVTPAKRQATGVSVTPASGVFVPYLAFAVFGGVLVAVRAEGVNLDSAGVVSTVKVRELVSPSLTAEGETFKNSAGQSVPSVATLSPSDVHRDAVAYVSTRQRDVGSVFNPLTAVPVIGAVVRVFDRFGNGPASGVMREGKTSASVFAGHVVRVTFSDGKSGDAFREFTVEDVTAGVLYGVPNDPSPVFHRAWDVLVCLAKATGDSITDDGWSGLVGATRDAFSQVMVHPSLASLFATPSAGDV